MGPLVTRKLSIQKVCDYFDVAKTENLEVVAGGGPVEHPDGGYYVAPTIYRSNDANSRLFVEEIFGPVLIVVPFQLRRGSRLS